jgi:hypothetical protein
LNIIHFDELKPGTYTLRLKARSGNQPWLKNEVQLIIIICPPFLANLVVLVSIVTGVSLLVFVIVKWRVSAVRKQERLKAKHERDMLELEAKALRAQMNPHFIFNCMNSIKSLIQQKDDDKAINYLPLFQNSSAPFFKILIRERSLYLMK